MIQLQSIILSDVALQDLGLHKRIGPVQNKGTVSKPVQQSQTFVGNHDLRSLLFLEIFALSISLTLKTHGMFYECLHRKDLLLSSLPLYVPKPRVVGQSQDNDEILLCLQTKRSEVSVFETHKDVQKIINFLCMHRNVLHNKTDCTPSAFNFWVKLLVLPSIPKIRPSESPPIKANKPTFSVQNPLL